MEFFINVLKIGGGILAILFIASIIALFFKRFRKVGWISLIVLAVGLVGLYFYYFTPESYERTYLKDTASLNKIALGNLATQANFHLGAAVDMNDLESDKFRKSFNSCTAENALKLGQLYIDNQVGPYDFSYADSIVNFAFENNIRLRGHTLVWGKLSAVFNNPDLEAHLENFSKGERKQKLKTLVDNHITTVLTRYKGKIDQWDVVNEPLAIFGKGELEDNVYLEHLGENYIADAFRLAHQIDPETKLFLNEIIFNYYDERAEGYYQFVKQMKDDGVPIHGVGFQSHHLYTLPDMDNLRSYIKRFTDLGLEVELTELDARLRLFGDAENPYQAQAEFYGDLLKVCLENTGCTGITFWGVRDDECWMNNQFIFPEPNEPLFYDYNYQPKPVLKELERVFQNYIQVILEKES